MVDEQELRAIASPELRGGEQILWTGRPDPKRGRLTFGIWLFAIPWTAFSLFWVFMATGGLWSATSSNAEKGSLWTQVVFGLFGLPFVLIGFGMLLSPFFGIRKLRATGYYITSDRMLTITTGKVREVKSVPISSVSEIIRRERKDGSGDLVFQIRTERDSDGDRVTREECFQGIPGVRKVEEILRQATERWERLKG